MIGVIDFFQDAPKNYRSIFGLGNIFQAPVPFSWGSRIPYLKFNVPGKSSSECLYSIETENIIDFNPANNEPIYELNLSSDEFVVCLAHKFRPVIVISPIIPIRHNSFTNTENCFLVLPIYSTKLVNGAYKNGITEEFILKTQAYQYSNIFYLPEDTKYGINESIVRFDKLLAINSDLLKPKPVSLTNDAYFCLMNWFYCLLGQELDEVILEYQESAKKNL
jgi:hypothetical protein